MHQNATHLAPKRSAFSSKTQCYLLQNAVLTHAKRKAKWCKTQDRMVKMVDYGAGYHLRKDK